VLVDEGTISAEDLDLIQYAETAEEAWALIKKDFLENINP
jgi:predicted Rossmann-fold nucleotide-binding protein